MPTMTCWKVIISIIWQTNRLHRNRTVTTVTSKSQQTEWTKHCQSLYNVSIRKM